MTKNETLEIFNNLFKAKGVFYSFRKLHQKWYDYFFDKRHISMEEFDTLNEFMIFFENVVADYMSNGIIKNDISGEVIPRILLEAFSKMENINEVIKDIMEL